MGEVIPFPTKEDRAEATEAGQEVATCKCGSQHFYLHKDSAVECAACGTFMGDPDIHAVWGEVHKSEDHIQAALLSAVVRYNGTFSVSANLPKNPDDRFLEDLEYARQAVIDAVNQTLGRTDDD